MQTRAGVVEWQTRVTQNHLRATAWGFDSLLRHPFKREKGDSCEAAPFFCCQVGDGYPRSRAAALARARWILRTLALSSRRRRSLGFSYRSCMRASLVTPLFITAFLKRFSAASMFSPGLTMICTKLAITPFQSILSPWDRSTAVYQIILCDAPFASALFNRIQCGHFAYRYTRNTVSIRPPWAARRRGLHVRSSRIANPKPA